jgi:hypothetical protein
MKSEKFTTEGKEWKKYKKSVIARLDRAIQRLVPWIPRSSRRMNTEKIIYNRGTEDICAI